MSATPTSFVRLFWKYAGYFAMIWKCACSFGFLIWSFLTVTVLFDSEFPFSKLVTCSATPTTSFVRFFWKCPSSLAMIWKCTSGLGFLIWSVLTLMALSDLEYPFAELVSATRDTFFVRFFFIKFCRFSCYKWWCTSGFLIRPFLNDLQPFLTWNIHFQSLCQQLLLHLSGLF